MDTLAFMFLFHDFAITRQNKYKNQAVRCRIEMQNVELSETKGKYQWGMTKTWICFEAGFQLGNKTVIY